MMEVGNKVNSMDSDIILTPTAKREMDFGKKTRGFNGTVISMTLDTRTLIHNTSMMKILKKKISWNSILAGEKSFIALYLIRQLPSRKDR